MQAWRSIKKSKLNDGTGNKDQSALLSSDGLSTVSERDSVSNEEPIPNDNDTDSDSSANLVSNSKPSIADSHTQAQQKLIKGFKKQFGGQQ